MSSTIDYLNANADWRFTITDVRDTAGEPFDLSADAVSVTFRPDADRATTIQSCSTADGTIAVTPGDATATPPTGPSIAITAAAAGRTWCSSRPMLVIGDVMIGGTGVDEVRRLAFIALPSTT